MSTFGFDSRKNKVEFVQGQEIYLLDSHKNLHNSLTSTVRPLYGFNENKNLVVVMDIGDINMIKRSFTISATSTTITDSNFNISGFSSAISGQDPNRLLFANIVVNNATNPLDNVVINLNSLLYNEASDGSWQFSYTYAYSVGMFIGNIVFASAGGSVFEIIPTLPDSINGGFFKTLNCTSATVNLYFES